MYTYGSVGMLMTSCFLGAMPNFGRKRITLLQPYQHFSSEFQQRANTILANGIRIKHREIYTLNNILARRWILL